MTAGQATLWGLKTFLIGPLLAVIRILLLLIVSLWLTLFGFIGSLVSLGDIPFPPLSWFYHVIQSIQWKIRGHFFKDVALFLLPPSLKKTWTQALSTMMRLN